MAPKGKAVAKAAKPAETIGLIGEWASNHGVQKKSESESEPGDDSVRKKPSCKRPAASAASSGRDRNKNHHFKKRWNELPQEIRDQYSSSTTRQQTVIINTLMEPGDKSRSMVPVWEGKHVFEDCML